MTLVSDPDLLVVNVVSAPTEEELEAEGGGESIEEQAAEAAEAEAGKGEPAADSE